MLKQTRERVLNTDSEVRIAKEAGVAMSVHGIHEPRGGIKIRRLVVGLQTYEESFVRSHMEDSFRLQYSHCPLHVRED